MPVTNNSVSLRTIMKARGIAVQEAAKALGVRCHTIYGLLRDRILAGTKLESGEWRVDPESISAYALRRSLRRASPRGVRRRSVIDVSASPEALAVR